MTKTMYCPFAHSLCAECAIYRGRHYYLNFSKQRRSYTDKPKDHDSVDFHVLIEFVEPWTDKNIQTRNEPSIRLKIIDMESGETKVCELSETKEWDWSNPKIMRIIDGRQVTSFDRLLEILCYKDEKGYQEVVFYEAPRFVLLAGG